MNLQLACLLVQVVYILPLLSDLLQDLVHKHNILKGNFKKSSINVHSPLCDRLNCTVIDIRNTQVSFVLHRESKFLDDLSFGWCFDPGSVNFCVENDVHRSNFFHLLEVLKVYLLILELLLVLLNSDILLSLEFVAQQTL